MRERASPLPPFPRLLELRIEITDPADDAPLYSLELRGTLIFLRPERALPSLSSCFPLDRFDRALPSLSSCFLLDRFDRSLSSLLMREMTRAWTVFVIHSRSASLTTVLTSWNPHEPSMAVMIISRSVGLHAFALATSKVESAV